MYVSTMGSPLGNAYSYIHIYIYIYSVYIYIYITLKGEGLTCHLLHLMKHNFNLTLGLIELSQNHAFLHLYIIHMDTINMFL